MKLKVYITSSFLISTYYCYFILLDKFNKVSFIYRGEEIFYRSKSKQENEKLLNITIFVYFLDIK